MIDFKLVTGGILPERGSPLAAGLDIASIDKVTVRANDRVLIHTGVILANLPNFLYLRVAPRSKLAYKHGINVLAGVIDADYRGEICVILHITSGKDYKVNVGDKIAQLIPTETHADMPVGEVSEVTETVRGQEGTLSKDERK